MKRLLIGFLVFLRIYQLGTTQYNPEGDIGGVVGDCLTEQNLDKNNTLSKLRGRVIPEDDADVLSFYECFGNKLHLINSDGDINYKGFEEYYIDNVSHFGPGLKGKVIVAVQECRKSPPNGLSIGLTVIRVSKCIEKHLE